MNYEIVPTDTFKQDFKDLSKKYPSLQNDLDILEEKLKVNPEMGVAMGNNTRKIRIAIKSKNRGKSGGARVITCNVLVDTAIYLLAIYDKSERESLSKNKIEELKRKNGLL